MVENITIARPYAVAVFELAQTGGALSGWSDMLSLLATVAQDPALARLAGDPRLSREGLAELVIDVCGADLTEPGQTLVRLLAENRRISVLPAIRDLYEEMKAEAEQVVHAEIVSAFPLSDEQQQALAAALAARFDREVRLDCQTDERLIGGAVVRVGDLVIDGSVAAHVEQLAAALTR